VISGPPGDGGTPAGSGRGMTSGRVGCSGGGGGGISGPLGGLGSGSSGLCLGGFLPVGLAIVAGSSPHPRPYVAWAWAVNAFASVVGSILAAIVAMAAGFKFLLVAAPVIYVAGALFLMRVEPAGAEKTTAPEV